MNLCGIFSIFFVVLWISTVSLEFSHGSIVRISQDSFTSTDASVEKHPFLDCYCRGYKVIKKLNKDVLERMFESMQKKNLCNETTQSKIGICNLLKDCSPCYAEKIHCIPISKSGGAAYNCSRMILQVRDRFLINGPSKVNKLRRMARQAPTRPECTYPTKMKTSSLKVLKYPSSIRITQKCIFGYTLPEGISREIHCSYQQNKWKPNGFEECKPFIDCTITLLSPGNLSCTTGTVDKAPVCTLACGHYEDKPPVPPATYECQIYGGWQPKLPYCSVAGTGLVLVPAPSIKFHTADETPAPVKKPKKGSRRRYL